MTDSVSSMTDTEMVLSRELRRSSHSRDHGPGAQLDTSVERGGALGVEGNYRMKRRTVRGIRTASSENVIWPDFRPLRDQVLRDRERKVPGGNASGGNASGGGLGPCTK